MKYGNEMYDDQLHEKTDKVVIPVSQNAVVPSTVLVQPVPQPVPQPVLQPVPQPVPFITSPSYVSVPSIPLYTPQQSFPYGVVQENSVYGSLVTGMNEGTMYPNHDTVRYLNRFDSRIR